MPRLLALDWNQRELTFILASTQRDQVTLEASGSVSLARDPDGAELSAEEIGKKLQAALAPHKPAKATVLVGVDRRPVDLFEFTLPPAADAELPELVLNQVMTEAPNVTEDSPVDFLASGSSAEPRRITAAALSSSELERIQAVCRTAGIAPEHIVLRTYATAALLPKERIPVSGLCLLVNVIGDEADFVLVGAGGPVLARTVRLPGGTADSSVGQRLADEIRRTMLVAPPGAESAPTVENVYLFGTVAEFIQLQETLSASTSVKVEVLDPFAGLTRPSNWDNHPAGRLVPLLGMLVEEARGSQRAFDFSIPVAPPKPANRRRQLVVSAIVAALVFGAGGYFYWDAFAAADAENQQLADQLKDLEGLVKKTAEKKKVITALADWNANSIVWLDELRDLSAKFPSGQDLVLQRMIMSPSRGGKASISFQGLARQPEVVSRMETTLRDERHEAQTPRVEERIQDKSYTWNFETTVSVLPRKPAAEEQAEKDEAVAAKTKGKSTKKATPASRSERKKASSSKSSKGEK